DLGGSDAGQEQHGGRRCAVEIAGTNCGIERGRAYDASHCSRLGELFILTLMLVLALLAGGSTHAGEMFKCTNAGGKIEYRDHPCDGASGEKIKAKDNSVGTGDSLGAIRARD